MADYSDYRPVYNAPRRSYVQIGNNGGRDYGGFLKPARKRSGAKFGISEKTQKPYVTGWNKSKRGFVTMLAYPYKTSKPVESKQGIEWLPMYVRIVNHDTKNVTHTTGMYDIRGKRLMLKEFNMIATRNGRGGYFGKHISRTYNR